MSLKQICISMMLFLTTLANADFRVSTIERDQWSGVWSNAKSKGTIFVRLSNGVLDVTATDAQSLVHAVCRLQKSDLTKAKCLGKFTDVVSGGRYLYQGEMNIQSSTEFRESWSWGFGDKDDQTGETSWVRMNSAR